MTTLIKNVLLIDGNGSPPFKADVLVRDDKIMAIGSFPNYRADVVVNGNEAYLTPGFIDTDTTSDRYLTLFSHPRHENFLRQGVTSVMMGQCGFSLAPNLYGSLQHLVNWTNTNHINMNWKSVKDFLTQLDNMRLGVNTGTFAGHRVMREDIIKDPREKFRKLSANELRVLRLVAERAMGEGAFGVSVGLGYGAYQTMPYHELRALTDVIKKTHGVISMHLRNEKDGIVSSVEEAITLSREMSLPVIMSHLRPFSGFEKLYKDALTLIEEHATNASVYFDINPFSWSAVPISSLLPEKERIRGNDVLMEMFKDSTASRALAKTMPRIETKKIIILQAPSVEFLNGKTLYDFAKNRGVGGAMALIKLMEATGMRAVVLYNNLDQKVARQAIIHERALVSTNSPSMIMPEKNTGIPERAFHSFDMFLSIADRSGMNIEQAIAKITSLPARLLHIDRRGKIEGGMMADMVLLSKDLSIHSVMVNGVWVVQAGEFKPENAVSGRALIKSPS